MVRDSEQSVVMPLTYRLSGQAFRGERQRSVSGNGLENSPIRVGHQWCKPQNTSFLFQWFIRFMVACFMVHGCNNGVLGVLMWIMMLY